MAQLQTALGWFDTIAEAQQAVQGLLAAGFTGETVSLSTQTGPMAITGGVTAEPARADRSSGRFFFSLFGSPDEGRSRWEARPGIPAPAPDGRTPVDRDPGEPAGLVQSRPGILVTVQTRSAAQAKQVAALLDGAGADDVALVRAGYRS